MFTAASALCGAASSLSAIIIGRVWAGAGGAGMYLGYLCLTLNAMPSTMVPEHGNRNLNIISTLITPKEQPKYIGMIGVVYGSGCILGPVIGGAFADGKATWRWVSIFLS